MKHVKLFEEFGELRFFCDKHRHLVCLPYSRANLDRMADSLGIKRAWYDPNPVGHYDTPKRDIARITQLCTVVSMRTIYDIAKGIKRDL